MQLALDITPLDVAAIDPTYTYMHLQGGVLEPGMIRPHAHREKRVVVLVSVAL